MLDYRDDRLDYGCLLIPPKAYHLDRAIAATYSLDLNTLLSIPVALFYSQTLEGKLDGERFQVLEAIQQTAKIVTVYCQERQIRIPDRYNRLYAFMEDMIVPVRPPDAFSSFHPKLWVLRFIQDKGKQRPIYRVLVLTRNLTYDHSWDLAVSLEGILGPTPRRINRPLIDFLKHLHRLREIVDFPQFIRDLAKVQFEAPPHFERKLIAFHPTGIKGYRGTPLIGVNADSSLCMSPFLDDAGLKELRRGTKGKFWLFSRKEVLEKISSDLLAQPHSQTYCISPLIGEGERMMDSDGSQEDRLDQNLHAKLYVFNRANKCRWFVGSANATKAALERNTEFLVELTGQNKSLMPECVVKELLGDKEIRGVFERFEPDSAGKPDPNAKQVVLIRRLEHELALAPLRGTLSRAKNPAEYILTVHLDLRRVRRPKGMSLNVGPLNCSNLSAVEFGKSNTRVFRSIKETDLSRFLVFALRFKGELVRQFLILMRNQLKGMPESLA